MPLTLLAGLAKKIGLPNYGSLGATCQVTVELDGALLHTDPEAFQRHVRTAYVACCQAVNDELARHQTPATNGHPAETNGHAHASAPRRETRKATVSQARALEAIAKRQDFDLAELLDERFRVRQAADLTLAQAGALIEELNGATLATAGGHR